MVEPWATKDKAPGGIGDVEPPVDAEHSDGERRQLQFAPQEEANDVADVAHQEHQVEGQLELREQTAEKKP